MAKKKAEDRAEAIAPGDPAWSDPVDRDAYPENEDLYIHPDDVAAFDRNYEVTGEESPAHESPTIDAETGQPVRE